MATYAEYLKSQGASEDEIKILDTAVSRKAFERMESALMSAVEARDKSKTDIDNYQKWYNEQAHPEYKRMEAAKIAAEGRVAQAAAIIKSATDQGLIEIAKAAGFEVEPAAAAKKVEETVDTSKFVTHDLLLSTAMREGEAIAAAQDIAAEHVYLFGKPLRNFRELRAEAMQRKVPVEQVWMEKFKVADARTARDASEKKEADDKIRKEEREKVTAEFADKYGNPDLRAPVISTNILTPRPDHGRAKQPWESGTDGENGSNSRVQRAMKSIVTGAN